MLTAVRGLPVAASAVRLLPEFLGSPSLSIAMLASCLRLSNENGYRRPPLPSFTGHAIRGLHTPLLTSCRLRCRGQDKNERIRRDKVPLNQCCFVRTPNVTNRYPEPPSTSVVSTLVELDLCRKKLMSPVTGCRGLAVASEVKITIKISRLVFR